MAMRLTRRSSHQWRTLGAEHAAKQARPIGNRVSHHHYARKRSLGVSEIESLHICMWVECI